jgi:hypothetical protein
VNRGVGGLAGTPRQLKRDFRYSAIVELRSSS